jgi:hypothetical protein
MMLLLTFAGRENEETFEDQVENGGDPSTVCPRHG